MTSRPPSHDHDRELPPGLRAELGLAGPGSDPSEPCAAAGGSAWAIDPERAVVIAATPEAAARLGMPGPATAMVLDAAMPGLRRLRELAARLGVEEQARETLLLWTLRGSERISAIVTHAPDAPGVLVVREVSAAPTMPAPASSPSKAEPRPPPPAPRDDAATLREIARRIREGQGKTTAHRDEDALARDHDAAERAAPPAAIDIAKLAHELKTPLSAIVAAAEIMRDERFGPIGNERYRGYASDIHDSARHALAVINGMLGHRHGSGDASVAPAARTTGPQHFAQVDLNALVRTTLSAMAPLADKAGVDISERLQERLPHIIADPVSVRQILLNLLTNAVKFTAPGGSTIVETRYELDGPLSLAVRDTGAGMSTDEIARALDRDQPAERTPRPGGGLGIGLPLVRQLAEANGAQVRIESQPGTGTLAVVTFAKGRIVPV